MKKVQIGNDQVGVKPETHIFLPKTKDNISFKVGEYNKMFK